MTLEEWKSKLYEIYEQYNKKMQERYKELGIENKIWFGRERKYCSDLLEERYATAQKLCEQYKEEYYKEHPEEAPEKK